MSCRVALCLLTLVYILKCISFHGALYLITLFYSQKYLTCYVALYLQSTLHTLSKHRTKIKFLVIKSCIRSLVRLISSVSYILNDVSCHAAPCYITNFFIPIYVSYRGALCSPTLPLTSAYLFPLEISFSNLPLQSWLNFVLKLSTFLFIDLLPLPVHLFMLHTDNLSNKYRDIYFRNYYVWGGGGGGWMEVGEKKWRFRSWKGIKEKGRNLHK